MDESKIIRKCIACNFLKPRGSLIKITKHFKTNEICVEPNSCFFGRSCYICRDCECIENAFKKKRIFKILKINDNNELKEKIRAVLEN